ncbi:CW domain-containing protein [Caenorhabditis elegans]|uniref:CW domain-containing protein n=1 Tax=Caenorhabditis elegans TaxID=6239 RepID=O45888_CAEEL|nr:CW domain-containing protein [Caenorhabditis elegans]CAB04896.3 CW domain-containing protein [Caenorhabditis elegans]|eukprot:NP_493399.3 Uncharacterized protein CELE_W04A4.2 [Caenorhabditis elegans]
MVLLSLLVFIFSIAISFSDGCVTIGSFEPRPACQCSSRELSVNDLYYDLERHPFAKTAISFANDRALWAGGFGDCWQSLSCKTEYNNHTIVIFDPTTAIMTSSASINATCDPYSQTWDIVGSGLRARRLWAMCVNFDFPVFTTRASPAADCDCANYLTTPSDVREHTIHYKDYHRLIAHSNVTNITRTQSYNGCVRRHDCNIEDGKTLLLFHNDQVYQSSSGDFQFECPDYTWSVSENWVPAYQLFYLMAVCVQDLKENLESPAPTTCQCEHFWSDTASIEGWSVLNLYFYSEVSENQCSWRVSCVELKYNVNSTAQLEIDGEFYVKDEFQLECDIGSNTWKSVTYSDGSASNVDQVGFACINKK